MANFSKLFNQIKILSSGQCLDEVKFVKAKPVIDIETLEIYSSYLDFAEKTKIHPFYVSRCLSTADRCKGYRIEYFEEWIKWDNAVKEKYTRKNNIYFLYGE